MGTPGITPLARLLAVALSALGLFLWNPQHVGADGPSSWRSGMDRSARERWQNNSPNAEEPDAKPSVPTNAKDILRDLLVEGKNQHDAGNWEESYKAFEKASELLIWKADSVDTPGEVVRLVGTTALNDTFAQYTGRIYEGVMLDYYQALNKLMQGDEAAARVHFNRLKLRQENAQAQLASFVAATSKTDTKGQEERVGSALSQMDGNLQQGVAAMPGELSAAQMRNPAGDALGAIFRKTSSVPEERASVEADQLLSMMASASVNPATPVLAEQMQSALGDAQKEIFILYEDGTGPSISEFRVDLPVGLFSDDVLYSGIALPKFVAGRAGAGQIMVNQSEQFTTEVTDVNRMASLEFAASYKAKVVKALVSAALKTAAQAAINNQINDSDSGLLGLVGKLVVAGTQAALTKADVRHWGNLPNSISLAVVPNAGPSSLTLTLPSGAPILIPPIPADADVLVYVRVKDGSITPQVFVQSLPVSSPVSGI
jgi:hypothetical protein